MCVSPLMVKEQVATVDLRRKGDGRGEGWGMGDVSVYTCTSKFQYGYIKFDIELNLAKLMSCMSYTR